MINSMNCVYAVLDLEVYLAPYTRTDFAACECAFACACTYIGAQARTLAHTLARMLRHTDARTYTSVLACASIRVCKRVRKRIYVHWRTRWHASTHICSHTLTFAFACAYASACTYIGPWGLELAWGRTYTAYKLSEV